MSREMRIFTFQKIRSEWYIIKFMPAFSYIVYAFKFKKKKIQWFIVQVGSLLHRGGRIDSEDWNSGWDNLSRLEEHNSNTFRCRSVSTLMLNDRELRDDQLIAYLGLKFPAVLLVVAPLSGQPKFSINVKSSIQD